MSLGKGNRRWIWLVAVVVVVAIVAVAAWQFVARGKQEAVAAADSTAVEAAVSAEESEEIAVPVELAVAARREIAAFYRAASVIEADRLVDLVARVGGRVQAVKCEEGEWVSKNDVLVELENGREKIQLQQADLKLADQERQLQRSREMLAEELISQQEFDTVDSAYRLAGTDRDLARIALEETYLRAPFAGQVTDRKIVLGQQVAIAQAMFTLADFDPLRVRVHLPEAIARKVVAGQRVLVTPDAAEAPLEAIVERVSPVVDPATSTVRLTLLLHDGTEGARVGGFAKVRITTDTHRQALSVPKLALVEEGGLRSVFVAEADTVRKVEVRTGLYDESHIEVLEGIDEGEFVVTLGQGGLRTGTKIEALNATEVGYGPAVEPESHLDSAGQNVAAVTANQ